MFPTDAYASGRVAFMRDRTDRDLAHRQLIRAARSADRAIARSTVVQRLRVRLGEALVASGTAIAGSSDERTAGAINRPA